MLRFTRGISQDTLAQKAGVCRSEISRLEAGFKVSARVRRLVDEALGIPSLLAGKDDKK